MYKGKIHTIESSEIAMLGFIRKELAKIPSGRQLFPVESTGGFEKVFLYLTHEQKEELDKIRKLGK